MLDVIIIGAGAGGLMAANTLKNKQFIILEKMNSAAKKLLITGGGRCNLTNFKNIRDFLDEVNYNKKFLYSTINQFGPSEIMSYFESEVPLKEEKENQIFPVSNKSKDVVDFLLKDVEKNIITNQEVLSIECDEHNVKTVKTKNNTYSAKCVIVATGGSSYQVLGSCGNHMKFAKDLGIDTIPLFPAETSILLKEIPKIFGTSFNDVIVKVNKTSKRGTLMFTHKGLSGTSIMQISEFIYKEKIDEIIIDFFPTMNEEDFRNLFETNRDSKPSTVLSKISTKKFAETITNQVGILENTLVKQCAHKQINKMIELCKKSTFKVLKVEELDKAYVTGGGISVKELNPKTFESKKIEGLYFIGECVDMHGPIGGYNITLALSSGYSAAMHINNQN